VRSGRRNESRPVGWGKKRKRRKKGTFGKKRIKKGGKGDHCSGKKAYIMVASKKKRGKETGDAK